MILVDLGGVLGGFGGSWGRFGGILGELSCRSEASRGILEVSRGVLEGSWGILGDLGVDLGGMLGPWPTAFLIRLSARPPRPWAPGFTGLLGPG